MDKISPKKWAKYVQSINLFLLNYDMEDKASEQIFNDWIHITGQQVPDFEIAMGLRKLIDDLRIATKEQLYIAAKFDGLKD